MKKLLLSLVAVAAALVSVNAQTEPSYVAKGTVGAVPTGWESYPALITDVNDVDVEVYGSDSIIIRNFCGVQDFDLVAVLAEDGSNVSSFYCYYYSESQQAKLQYSYTSGYYDYVYTGLDDPYGMYLCHYEGYAQWEKDDEAMTGSLACGYVTGYYNDGTSALGGYYVTWEPKAADEPTYTATGVTGNSTYDEGGYAALVNSTKSDVKVYGTDSIVVDNWCGVEGYGICIVLDEEGHVAEAKGVKDGISTASGSATGYMYVYTGLDDDVDYAIYIPAYGDYYYITASPGTVDDQSGYIEIWGYAYPADYSSYTQKYYYIGWGTYDANPTAIKSVSVAADDADAPVYNLAGQRVNASTKGLLIKNGKKILVK